MARRTAHAPTSRYWRVDPEWQAKIDAQPWPDEASHPQCWRKGLLAALVSRDGIDFNPPGRRYHISIQHRDRVPSWNEFAAACHELRPGVVFVIGVPPRSWWLNVHEHVLHAWELKDDALIAQWKFERQGHTPT